jgi:hypothetical protein
MNDYLLLMHDDARDTAMAEDAGRWERYLDVLRASGRFDGGSSIGDGARFAKGSSPAPARGGPSGFLRVRAGSLEEAAGFLAGNPVYDAGGTVEIRALPRD